MQGRTGNENRLAGLEGGADAYVAKPFGRRDLLVPIEVLFRRRQPNQTKSTIFELDDVRLDTSTHRAWVAGCEISLTKIEAHILRTLLEGNKEAVRKRQLVEAVWGSDWVGDDHVIRVHVANLRKKMSTDGRERIATVRGVGYRLVSAEDRIPNP